MMQKVAVIASGITAVSALSKPRKPISKDARERVRSLNRDDRLADLDQQLVKDLWEQQEGSSFVQGDENRRIRFAIPEDHLVDKEFNEEKFTRGGCRQGSRSDREFAELQERFDKEDDALARKFGTEWTSREDMEAGSLQREELQRQFEADQLQLAEMMRACFTPSQHEGINDILLYPVEGEIDECKPDPNAQPTKSAMNHIRDVTIKGSHKPLFFNVITDQYEEFEGDWQPETNGATGTIIHSSKSIWLVKLDGVTFPQQPKRRASVGEEDDLLLDDKRIGSHPVQQKAAVASGSVFLKLQKEDFVQTTPRTEARVENDYGRELCSDYARYVRQSMAGVPIGVDSRSGHRVFAGPTIAVNYAHDRLDFKSQDPIEIALSAAEVQDVAKIKEVFRTMSEATFTTMMKRRFNISKREARTSRGKFSVTMAFWLIVQWLTIGNSSHGLKIDADAKKLFLDAILDHDFETPHQWFTSKKGGQFTTLPMNKPGFLTSQKRTVNTITTYFKSMKIHNLLLRLFLKNRDSAMHDGVLDRLKTFVELLEKDWEVYKLSKPTATPEQIKARVDAKQEMQSLKHEMIPDLVGKWADQ